MKIVLLFSAFILIVNGRALENGQNKRDLILKALSNIRKKDMWLPGQMMESPDLKPPQTGLSEKVEQIQEILKLLAQHLEYFKGEYGNGDGQEGDLQFEIENLLGEIKSLKETLSHATTLKNSLLGLSWSLYMILGDVFYDNFMAALETEVLEEDESLSAEEYGTTGGGYTVLSPREQLAEIAKTVKEVAKIIQLLVIDGDKSYKLVHAIMAGLDSVRSNAPTTTSGYETTTWSWGGTWNPLWESHSTDHPTTEETTLSPTTTEYSPTTTGNTETTTTTGNTETTTTTGNTETTTTTGNTETTTTTGNTETTPEPASTTESMVVRKKNFLRRQLIDLLLQKLQKKTAARRGDDPPY